MAGWFEDSDGYSDESMGFRSISISPDRTIEYLVTVSDLEEDEITDDGSEPMRDEMGNPLPRRLCCAHARRQYGRKPCQHTYSAHSIK